MKPHHRLLAWQRANALVLAVLHHADRHWTPRRSEIFSQLRRAVLSIQLNIAEGQAHGPGARCRNHMRIAFGSAVETTELLEILESLDGSYAELIKQSNDVEALVFRLMKSIRV